MRLSCFTSSRSRDDRGLDVVAHRPGELELDPLGVVARRHLDDLAPQLAVGEDHPHVIVGVELAVEQVDLAHDADDAAGLDAVADMERPEQHQHDAGGEIAERSLQRQADGDAERAEHRDEAGGGDAEGRQHRAEGEDQDEVADRVRQEERDRAIDALGAHEHALHAAVQEARYPPAEQQDDDRADDAQAIRRDQRHQGIGGVGPLLFKIHQLRPKLLMVAAGLTPERQFQWPST